MQELILRKGDEKYVFRFDDASRKALLGIFGRFAAHPELGFSWHDAAVLCNRLRRPDPEPAARPVESDRRS